MNNLEKAANALRSAHRVVLFTGAGISADSRIPTFRDKLNGFWEKYDPQTLETAKAFRENPARVWGWYLWRRRQMALAEPNAAHLTAPLLAATGRHVAVITQNIDDLHERAGLQNVVHLHGSLDKPKCVACNRPAELTAEQMVVAAEGEQIEPPRCNRCDGRLRPGVVWFEENLPKGAWKTAMTSVKACDVLIFSIGTSAIVKPAADMPEIALAAGATVIHVNVRDVGLGEKREIMLIGSASTVMPKLIHTALDEL
ncbi:NAD-dependent protein deacylase Sir2 [Pseudomonas fluorescens]|uniref:SIR2 family NAD-dependent protein deacylase n=1 Tax=Pseudomonas fluorescens TaxID=294 RepID=UPI00123F410C|nr:NAD-dependent protein deacylase [Pseudomonas fluorescens]VVP31439.1 NAD-dependent protein deacylase Sir2 [Pseudomonas fluorescens]